VPLQIATWSAHAVLNAPDVEGERYVPGHLTFENFEGWYVGGYLPGEGS